MPSSTERTSICSSSSSCTVLLLLLLALLAILQSGSNSFTEATTTTAPLANETVHFRLGLIWDSLEGAINISTWGNLVFPTIKNYCPSSPRVNRTEFTVFPFSLNQLPTINEWKQIVQALSEYNFVFFGVKQNSITQVFNSLEIGTSLPEFPAMQKHLIAPLPQSLLLNAFMKVIEQRIAESQYPADPSNFKAAMFIDDSVVVSDMYPMFSYFSQGCTYYKFNRTTLENNLLAVRYAEVINIIVILLDANDGQVLRDVAHSLDMFSSRHRWFIHGPRLINEPSYVDHIIPSENITSIEFGRIRDALAQGIRSTTGILLFDLMSIWTPYLKYYLCEEKQPVNRTIYGFTGQFKLNPDGSATRTFWELDIYAGLGSYRHQVGQWRSDGKFEMMPRKDAPQTTETILANLRLDTFKVATLLAPPYIEYRPGAQPCSTCNDELTGMYIEICRLMLQSMGIVNYTFHLQSDNYFGSFDGTTWNGVLKTVMDGRARIGCAPVTISSGRMRIVDFSETIHPSRLSLLLRQSNSNPVTQAFQFLTPLDWRIWLSVVGALVVVALALFAMNKIAPNKDANYNVYNSIFFSFAEVVQGTSGTTPTQISGRILVSFFWFFTLFLFLSYVANYAVLRTLIGIDQKVTSLATLMENRIYECGSVSHTVTDSLLATSTYLTMQQVHLLMTEKFKNGTVADMQQALTLINDNSRNFVLINDNLQNQYYRDIGCDLISTGDFYDIKNALVLPRGNEYGHLVDTALAKIVANISALQTKFFTVAESQRQSCYDGSFVSAVRYYTPKDAWPIKDGALTLADTLGIAVINLLGCCIAIALSGIERLIGRMQTRRSENRRMRQVEKAGIVKFRRPSE